MIRPSSLYAVRRRAAAVAAVAAAGVAATLASAPAANAAFSVEKCRGDAITGTGASFQNNAHSNVFTPEFRDVFCFGSSSVPNTSYVGSGSGAGRNAMGANAGTNNRGAFRFAGTDEPLSTTNKNLINAGNTTTTGDDAFIHQIPIASGAIVPLVNLPNACDVNSLPASQTTETGPDPDFTNRVKFTRAEFEKIMYGDQSGANKASQWKDIFPTIQGKTDAQDTACQDKQITRIVRQDSSGSTFALKDALGKFPGARNWATFNSNNRVWPNATITPGACGAPPAPADSPVGVNGPEGTPSLVTACADTGEPLVDKLVATDGSVGYVDLSTAVAKNMQVTPNLSDNDTYFTQLENGSGAFVEPTLNANGFRTGTSTDGANCTTTVYTGVPTEGTRDGNWSAVSGTNSSSGYAICTLTYALAFDDNALAYGISEQEQRQARTVKDYLTAAVDPGAQGDLKVEHYAALPTNLANIARAGVASINWNKAGTGAGPNTGGGGGSTGGGSTGGGSTGGGSTPPVVRPSNAFSVPRTSLSSRTGTATLSIRVPGAGTVVVEPTATVTTSQRRRTRRVRLGRVTRTVSRAGTVRVTVRPTGSALAALKKAGRLRVSLRVSFTPRNGTRRTTTRTITLKYTKPKRRARR